MSAINQFHTALEELWAVFESHADCDHDNLLALKQKVQNLLFNFDESDYADAGNPFVQYGTPNLSVNRTRLDTAVRNGADTELLPSISLMFDVPGRPEYSAMTTVLHKYIRFRRLIAADVSSDSDSD